MALRFDQNSDIMNHIQNTAEQSVRNLMKELSAKNSCNPTDTFVHLKVEEYIYDGSIINLYARMNKSDGSALFDFTRYVQSCL
jgi:hypothetical protein